MRQGRRPRRTPAETASARGPLGEELAGARCRVTSSAVEERDGVITLRLGVRPVGMRRANMYAAARDLEFEEAARLRDEIRALQDSVYIASA